MASAEQLGQRIRQLRSRHGWTLEELAQRSEVSRAMLSKIERGENNPTLVVAVKIALALGLTTSQLIGIEERREAVKVPKDRRLSFRDPQTGFERQVFPALEGRALEFVRHVIPQGSSSGELPALAPRTEKYLLMEQGTMRARIGTQEYMLEGGDMFYFVADVPQQFDNIGEEVCSYFVIKIQG
ncbi:XRE family transcriptional regulator [Ktedonosporobacter rubrisoli]|uniref:XRE family transcriptional regulator n=2 Tax=Ktedonosporobacter rubrisoli TaxID=2509675 RepID=A0A4P6K662_KTERU|nr:XRE family transcriptional regulator [Ktedonosporobacter rubrisoli]